MGTQYSSDIQVRRITEGIQFHFFFTYKPGLEHVDLALKVLVTDAVSQLTTSSANVKPKPLPNPTTAMVDTDMVVMDTDMDTDTAVDTDMVTTLVRDLLMLNLITDIHTLTTV